MTSSASSPFELLDVAVQKNESYRPVDKPLFARYVLIRAVMHERAVNTPTTTIMVEARIELARDSWLSNFGPGPAGSIARARALVGYDEMALAVNPQPFEALLLFACEQLNPMLDTFITLYGIEHNIDITVEHRLRPVDKLLQNLITTPKNGSKNYFYNQRKGFWE